MLVLHHSLPRVVFLSCTLYSPLAGAGGLFFMLNVKTLAKAARIISRVRQSQGRRDSLRLRSQLIDAIHWPVGDVGTQCPDSSSRLVIST